MLGTVVATLLFANLVCIYLKFKLGYNFAFINTFYFNNEANIPSFYSAVAIFISALFLFLIGNLKIEDAKGQRLSWKLLGYVFVFLGIDEFISIHETLTGFTRGLIGKGTADGYLHYAWVIPYVSVFGFLFLYLTRFFFRLPTGMKVKLMGAGIIFLSGAVGVEMIGGRYEFIHGPGQDFNYAILATIEELLEMVGIIAFIYALSKYYVERVENKQMRLGIEVSEDPKSIGEPNLKPQNFFLMIRSILF